MKPKNTEGSCPNCEGQTELNGNGGTHCFFCNHDYGNQIPENNPQGSAPAQDSIGKAELVESRRELKIDETLHIGGGTHPLEVTYDCWGINPMSQLLLNHRGGDVAVSVRYSKEGRICEVLIEDPDVVINIAHDANIEIIRGAESPWEIEREARQ
jgi:hypothetical protein